MLEKQKSQRYLFGADTEAPVDDARELEKIMIDAALIILPGTHYAYLENLGQVINILNSFLKENQYDYKSFANFSNYLSTVLSAKKIITYFTTESLQ